jgi:hypothetical protein
VLNGEDLLSVDGPIAGHGIGFEVADFGEFFEAHDGEGRATEGVLDEDLFVREVLV